VHIGQSQIAHGSPGTRCGLGSTTGTRRQSHGKGPIVVVGESMETNAKLAQLADAFHPPGAGLGLHYRREQQRSEDGDDGDDTQ